MGVCPGWGHQWPGWGALARVKVEGGVPNNDDNEDDTYMTPQGRHRL